MAPFPQLAEGKEEFIAYTAGSVGIALITSIFELSAFFVVSSSMMLMLTVPPLLQWLFCDEPSLSIPSELLAYIVPCFCFMATYALPWLVAFTLCRTGSIIAALYRILIYRLSVYWVPHLILVISICYYPERRRTLRKTSLEFLNMVTFYGLTTILKVCEIAWKTYEKIMSSCKWLVEVRKPKIEFTYSRIDGKWSVNSETAKPTITDIPYQRPPRLDDHPFYTKTHQNSQNHTFYNSTKTGRFTFKLKILTDLKVFYKVVYLYLCI